VVILPPPSRRLGAASLVLGLIPFAGYAVVLIGMPFATMWEERGMFAGLGWLIIGFVVVAFLNLFAGVPAIVLGVTAMRQDRGYGLGVAGLVLGSLSAAQGIVGVPGFFSMF